MADAAAPAPAPAPTPTQLPFFVYGTLMTGFKNHGNVVRGRFSRARDAEFDGAFLVHLVGFPGMYFAGSRALGMDTSACSGRVKGQLLEVPADVYEDVKRDMDLLEGFQDGDEDDDTPYVRRRVRVHVAATEDRPAEEVEAWTYECRMDPRGCGGVLVPHGDWRRYLTEAAEEDAGDDWEALLRQRIERWGTTP